MGQVLSMLNLGARINAAHHAVVAAACNTLERAVECGNLLEEAKRGCRHGEWQVWIEANTKVSYSQSAAYMQLASGWEQIKAKTPPGRVLGIKEAIKLLAKPKAARTAELIEDDEDEDRSVPGALPDSMRIRGFLYRAKEAAEMANADDLHGLKITEAMRLAASNAAEAWIELLAKLERE
jgi:hypothetical protein